MVSERGADAVSREPVLTQAGRQVLAYFRRRLVPGVLAEGDMIRLAWPGAQEDFRLGLCLYGLELLRSGGPGTPERGAEDRWRKPDLLLSLRFFAFANRKSAFHSVEALDELILLEAALRAVYAAPDFSPGEGGAFRLGLDKMERGEETALWQSFQAPSQSAVWFSAQPVAIPGRPLDRAPATREVRADVKRKEG